MLNAIIALLPAFGAGLITIEHRNRGNQVDKSMTFEVVSILIMLHPRYANDGCHLNTFKLILPYFAHQLKFALVRIGRL